MTDARPFATMVPQNAEVYCSRLEIPGSGPARENSLRPLQEPLVESIPVHDREPGDVAAVRAYVVSSGEKRYRIYRGDMHRHTDVSQDFKYDGSLIEVYRYALDAAGFDYVAAHRPPDRLRPGVHLVAEPEAGGSVPGSGGFHASVRL